eukprot:GFYU01004080.1.p1 GENE.GFYU01004080.1~~GFYU01004080.1.p1  ORF type:complete len:967 (-),score=114.75 GFYU01004080.1:232-3132(-)
MDAYNNLLHTLEAPATTPFWKESSSSYRDYASSTISPRSTMSYANSSSRRSRVHELFDTPSSLGSRYPAPSRDSHSDVASLNLGDTWTPPSSATYRTAISPMRGDGGRGVMSGRGDDYTRGYSHSHSRGGRSGYSDGEADNESGDEGASGGAWSISPSTALSRCRSSKHSRQSRRSRSTGRSSSRGRGRPDPHGSTEMDLHQEKALYLTRHQLPDPYGHYHYRVLPPCQLPKKAHSAAYGEDAVSQTYQWIDEFGSQTGHKEALATLQSQGLEHLGCLSQAVCSVKVGPTHNNFKECRTLVLLQTSRGHALASQSPRPSRPVSPRSRYSAVSRATPPASPRSHVHDRHSRSKSPRGSPARSQSRGRSRPQSEQQPQSHSKASALQGDVVAAAVVRPNRRNNCLEVVAFAGSPHANLDPRPGSVDHLMVSVIKDFARTSHLRCVVLSVREPHARVFEGLGFEGLESFEHTLHESCRDLELLSTMPPQHKYRLQTRIDTSFSYVHDAVTLAAKEAKRHLHSGGRDRTASPMPYAQAQPNCERPESPALSYTHDDTPEYAANRGDASPHSAHVDTVTAIATPPIHLALRIPPCQSCGSSPRTPYNDRVEIIRGGTGTGTTASGSDSGVNSPRGVSSPRYTTSREDAYWKAVNETQGNHRPPTHPPAPDAHTHAQHAHPHAHAHAHASMCTDVPPPLPPLATTSVTTDAMTSTTQSIASHAPVSALHSQQRSPAGVRSVSMRDDSTQCSEGDLQKDSRHSSAGDTLSSERDVTTGADNDNDTTEEDDNADRYTPYVFSSFASLSTSTPTPTHRSPRQSVSASHSPQLQSPRTQPQAALTYSEGTPALRNGAAQADRERHRRSLTWLNENVSYLHMAQPDDPPALSDHADSETGGRGKPQPQLASPPDRTSSDYTPSPRGIAVSELGGLSRGSSGGRPYTSRYDSARDIRDWELNMLLRPQPADANSGRSR